MSARPRPGSLLATKLVARGVRLTNQRRKILELIESEGGHLDAARIQELARERQISVDRATVYRTLALLKQHGLVEELDFLHVRGDQHFYEARGLGDHLHACCYQCGRVSELRTATLDRLKEELRDNLGFRTESVRVEVGGCCKECAEHQEQVSPVVI
ncbi:MAG: transcriptional repressor [Armatimonadota bacterium]|nr:MAG: transcriptional repressor [Armatimonadota bacterium]